MSKESEKLAKDMNNDFPEDTQLWKEGGGGDTKSINLRKGTQPH